MLERQNTNSKSDFTVHPAGIAKGSDNELKLHISLKRESYQAVRETLNALLHQSLESGAIIQFKYVNDYVFEQIEVYKPLVSGLKKHQRNKRNVDITDTSNPDLYNKLVAYKNGHHTGNFYEVDYPSFQYGQIPRLINEMQNRFDSLERFENSGQYTIYLPVNPDLAKVSKLVQEINKILSDHQAAPGMFYAVESRIGHYLSLRKAYLNGEEQTAQNRINAHQHTKSSARSRRVRKEQESTELYEQLSFVDKFNASLKEMEDQSKNLPENSRAKQDANALLTALRQSFNTNVLESVDKQQFSQDANLAISNARKSELTNYSGFKKAMINLSLCIAAFCVGGVGLAAFLIYRGVQYRNNQNHFWYVPKSSVTSAAETNAELIRKFCKS